MFILWKDHTSIKEANEITQAATNNDVNYLSHMGGIYSSEWYWAKALHIFRVDSSVKAATYSWVEHCDWMTALMCGVISEGLMIAGHPAASAEISGPKLRFSG